jgi:SPP1 family predicted phage head-tail adaptor
MPIETGSLKHRVTILQFFNEQDSDGNIEDTWIDYATVWANVRYLNAKEFVASQLEGSKVVATIKMRYLRGITQHMRVRHGDKIYNINGILPDAESGKEYVILPVSEVTTD